MRGPALIAGIAGVLLGDHLGGVRLLRRIPEPMVRKLLYGLILALGIYMAVQGIRLCR